MQATDLSAAVPPEMRELSASRQKWYTGCHGDRFYWVYTPASYQAGTAVPLIMILHGCGQAPGQPLGSHPWAIAYDTHMNQLVLQP
jgi:poly(3-hydroxybutyrate) depolymerase